MIIQKASPHVYTNVKYISISAHLQMYHIHTHTHTHTLSLSLSLSLSPRLSLSPHLSLSLSLSLCVCDTIDQSSARLYLARYVPYLRGVNKNRLKHIHEIYTRCATNLIKSVVSRWLQHTHTKNTHTQTHLTVWPARHRDLQTWLAMICLD